MVIYRYNFYNYGIIDRVKLFEKGGKMNFFLFFVLIVWLCFITVRQSARKKETESFLDRLQKEIFNIKAQISELKNRIVDDSSAPVQDQPFALFTYITFLNIGLLCVAVYRKWNFLVVLGAVGTVLTELGWVIEYFTREKVFIATAIFLWFDLLFCGATWYEKRIARADNRLRYSAVSLPFVTFLFALFLVIYQRTGTYPYAIFTCLLIADLCLIAITLTDKALLKFNMMAGPLSKSSNTYTHHHGQPFPAGAYCASMSL